MILGSIIISGSASAATINTTYNNHNQTTIHDNNTTLKTNTTKKIVKNTTINKKTKKPALPDPQVWRNGVNVGDYGTIAEAVEAAENGDTIILEPGTYNEIDDYNIEIDKDLTINGSNDPLNPSIIDAQGNGDIFTIAQGITVNLEYLTLINGNSNNGGAIYNNGILIDTNNTYTDNNANTDGGAICNDNILTETNSTFNGDNANNYGGAIYNEGILTETNTTFNSNTGSWGGVIYNEGTITNINCTFNNNNAINNGGAITNLGNLIETNSTYTDNNAYDGGGAAIYNFNTLSETDSTFNQNYSPDDGIILNGGGNIDTPVSITSCTFTNNNGEAIVNGGYLTVTDNTFTNNIAEDGGAIYNDGDLTIIGSNFTNNQAIDDSEGGAIDNEGTLTDTNNIYNGNTASDCGGAIYNDNGCTLTESNSIFTDNTATNYGGAIYNDGFATVNFNRIVNNDAVTGTQIYNDIDGTIDATLNWWGTNTPNTDGNDIIGVNYNPWIILTLTANPTTIITGDTSTITADLTHDNNGVYYNPANGVIPYTGIINFTTTIGTINNSNMINGLATTTLNTNNPGTANVTASLDDATVQTNINIEQNPLITNIANQNTQNVDNTATFTITITNQGTTPITNININDIPPTGFTASISMGTYNNGIWNIPTLNQGNTATLTFTEKLTSNQAGTNITNHATETQDQDPYTINIPNASIYVNEANVVLSQVGGYSGKSVTFIVTASDQGPDTATNININDVIPAGLTGVIVTPSVGTYSNGVWTIPSLANGVNATLNITGTSTPLSVISNLATITSQTEYNPFIPYTSAESVFVPSVDVESANYPWASTSGSPLYEYLVGNAPVLTFEVWNNGPDDASGVVYQYTMGSGLLYEGSSADMGTVTFNNLTNSLTWDIGNIPDNGDILLKVFVRVMQSGDSNLNLTTTGNLTHVDQYDSKPASENSTCQLTSSYASADVAVSQSYTTNNSSGVQYITYTVSAVNNGPDNATGVQVTDLLPPGLQYISSNVSIGSYNASNGVWNIGNLANGNTETLTITAEVTGKGTFKNNAVLTSENEFDPNINNNSQETIYTNSGTYTPTVDVESADYQWWYILGNESIVGNAPVLTFEVWNNGPDDASGVVYQYTMGSGLLYEGSSADMGTVTFNNLTNSLTWDIGNIPDNGDILLKVFVRVMQSGDSNLNLTTTGNLTHVDQYDSDPASENSTFELTSPSSADVAVSQSYTTNNSSGVQYITYTVSAVNNGPDNATGVQVTDLLPPGLQYISSNASIGSYNASNGVWNIGNLANGNTETLTITAEVTINSGAIINNAVLTSENEFDPNINNNSQETIYTIQQ